MKNRCKATVRTAQQQRRRCVLSLSLHYTMQRFAVYLRTTQCRGYPPLPHIMVDSEPPFRCWTLRYACKHARSRSYTNPPLPTKKSSIVIAILLFFCEREWMRYRVRKPRFAPLRIATAPLRTLLNIALHNAAFCCIFENCPTPRLSTSSAY